MVDEFEDFELRQSLLADLQHRISETPVDVRDALAAWRPDADEFQRQVIGHQSQVLRVVAPAGCGKTQTLINRVVHRVSQGANAKRILMLTFDNAAVTSLKETLQRQVSVAPEAQRTRLEEILRNVRISTLNAFGYWILRQYASEEYKQVADSRHQNRLFRQTREALKKRSPEREATLPANVRNRVYIEVFGLLKNQTFDPRAPQHQKIADFLLSRPGLEYLFPEPNNPALVKATIQAILWMFEKYDELLRRDGRMDFDDQKLRAYVAMRTRPALEQTLQSLYSEIIVDEFQDINLLDFALIRSLAAKSVLVVTGDDDQAIYGFRGCSPEYIINLENHLGRTVVSHELRTNYRCPRNVVEHADRLIRHNTWRIPKQPLPHHAFDSEIKVVSAHTADLEARMVVSFIKRVRRSKPELAYKDFAVLYRTNAQSLPLQLHFILEGIPYAVRKENNILANEELEKLLGALRLKREVNAGRRPTPHDGTLAVQAYFRWTHPGDGDRVERLFEDNADVLDVLGSDRFYEVLPKAKESNVREVVKALLDAPNLQRALEVLASRFKGLRQMVGSLEDVIDEAMPLGEIFDVGLGFKGSVADFVGTIERALLQARQSNAGNNEDDGVSLLTYFRSKGRQWHSVILTTCNEGLIPHRRAPLEDERRLFYVAITRATSNLLLSYLKKACGNVVSPSRFLREAALLK